MLLDRETDGGPRHVDWKPPSTGDAKLPERLYLIILEHETEIALWTATGGGQGGNKPLRIVEDIINAGKSDLGLCDDPSSSFTVHLSEEDAWSHAVFPLSCNLLGLVMEDVALVAGADSERPLYFRRITRQPPGPLPRATLEFFELQAAGPASAMLHIELDKGRLMVEKVVQELGEGVQALKLLNGENWDVISSSGHSRVPFKCNQTYQVFVARDLPDPGQQTSFHFSDSELSFQRICEDFYIECSNTPWDLTVELKQKWPEHSMPPMPSALLESLNLFARFNTMRPGLSRRSMVEVLMTHALKMANSGEHKLRLHEGAAMEVCVPTMGPRGAFSTATESGPADYVVGDIPHFDETLQQYVSLVVVVAKDYETFREGRMQAFAKAAVCLNARWLKRSGATKQDGPCTSFGLMASPGFFPNWTFMEGACDQHPPGFLS